MKNATMSMLDTLMETISFAVEEAHGRNPRIILGDRTWWGMGMIGNKPHQSHAYFELVRSEARKQPAGLTICEVGLNGGHSAALFLEAAGRKSQVKMFDIGTLTYTRTALRLLQRLYPGQVEYIQGDSHATTLEFARTRGRVCDVMSIDGAHDAHHVARDLEAARRMSKTGALLLLDDMTTHRDDLGRAGVEAAAVNGRLAGLSCVPDRVIALPKTHRFANSGAAKYIAHAWCYARFAL